ncbi:hypothetical protein [Actinokineospora enzanensis]|uniref:hypothetical protein n=1 Tax=Actinokineospora enzanensis TaxID=155975 RepID=UPI0012ECB9CA
MADARTIAHRMYATFVVACATFVHSQGREHRAAGHLRTSHASLECPLNVIDQRAHDQRAIENALLHNGFGAEAIPAKARNTLAFFRPLAKASGIHIRVHGTVLHNSIYRFDDDMLVNTHVYGFVAGHAPLVHIRRLSDGDLFETYSESFDRVWETAQDPTW